ncbi:MAG: hypothetical protein ABIZ09_09545 [Rhodoferax sp.]
MKNFAKQTKSAAHVSSSTTEVTAPGVHVAYRGTEQASTPSATHLQ